MGGGQVSAVEPLGGARVDPALMLSIGAAPTKERPYPQRLGFFRPKEGREGQWSGPARAFNERYGVQYDASGEATNGPKVLPVRLPASRVEDVLDIRYLAWGQDRLAARGFTNYAEFPGMFGRAETIRAFPIDTPPVDFDITGPHDEACLGGHHDIPLIMERGKPSGKPALAVTTTLTFVLAEVGSFTTPVAITTKSRKSRDRLFWKLRMLSQTGTMAHWVMLLAVRPDRVSYRDDDGKRHTAPAYTLDLIGPIASLADRRHLTIDEIQHEVDKLADRGLLNPSGGPPVAPQALATAAPSSLEEAGEPEALPPGEDPEEVVGEVVDD